MTFDEFKRKYEKVQVEEYPNSVPEDPVVSVCVHTYQHEPYIRECLDSIIMQETEFPFEILLGDDASTDGTREICIEYAEKYPEKIKLFLHNRANNIYIGSAPSGRFNFLYNLYSAKAEFLATCEGDDYWTDPLKLQKQYNAIVANKSVSLVSCKVQHIENGRVVGFGEGGTRTYFFRNSEEISKMAKYSQFIHHGDNLLRSILDVSGKELVLDETMAAWRKHAGGVWGSLLNSVESNRILEFQRASTAFWIGVYHFEQGRKNIAIKHIVKAMMKLMISIPELRQRVSTTFCMKLFKRKISNLIKRK